MVVTDRIVIDVGGAKFVTATQTLKSNSTYFASLLSGEWMESSSNDDGQELFLDQDPVTFGKLLGFMRRGMIKIEDIDIDVLLLAEFLGLDRLLLGVKVRWYFNIGKGPVDFDSDEGIAAAFHEVHGGISKAISNNLFQYFVEQDNVNAEMDRAIMTIYGGSIGKAVSVNEIVNGTYGESIVCGGIFGALNGLHASGYTSPGQKLKRDFTYNNRSLYSFSRRRHSAMRTGDATSIFILTQDEIRKRRENAAKQFAVYVMNTEQATEWILAPSDFFRGDDDNEVNDITNPYSEALITHVPDPEEQQIVNETTGGLVTWLEMNNFTTPESMYMWPSKDIAGDDGVRIRKYLSHGRVDCEVQIFSRPL
jgi:hypothetical protein